MPTFVELPASVRDRIKAMRFDWNIEKHEGPFDWDDYLEEAKLMIMDGYQVLLPLDENQFPNIEIVRVIVSKDDQSLTLFLKDHTYSNPADEYFMAGRLAVCDKIPDTELFIAVVYHEWFAVKNDGMP